MAISPNVNPADAARGVVAYAENIGACVVCKGHCNTLKKSPPADKLVLVCPPCEPPYDYDRKALVEKIRDEGRAARRAGRHVQTNPYPSNSMDSYQWRSGWWSEDHAIVVERADARED